MSASCKLNLRYLCIFGFVLIFSLWFEYLTLSSLTIKYQLTPSPIPALNVSATIIRHRQRHKLKEYESKHRLHQQIIANYTQQLAQQQHTLSALNDAIDAQSVSINEYKERENPLSFTNWIKGIGDTQLSNDGFSEICVVPNVPGFELDALSAAHSDPTYHHIHDCNDKKKWSELIEIDKEDRYLLIHHNECSGRLFQYQSPSILRGHLLKINADHLWSEINPSEYVHSQNDSFFLFPLESLTQSIWIGCNDEQHRPKWKYNHFVSLLPLKIRSPSRYQQQLTKYNQYKFRRQNMPNVIIFVVDSTSRSNFHRGSRSTVDYLERILAAPKSVNYDIFQFFRHSTIGWGTGLNLMAMINGGTKERVQSPLDLFAFYHEMGYIVPAMEEYLSVRDGDWDTKNASNIYVSAQWDQTMEYCFYLTHNVFDFNCRNVQYWSTESWVHFLIDAVNRVQPEYDKLPYFMVVHAEDNHRANGHFQFVIDRYFRELVEYLDFENTIFHLVADHGALVGTSTSTQFGRWESTNPVSMLFVPRNMFNEDEMDRLRVNQQRFVTHFDFHVFFKQIPLIFTDHFGSQLIEEVDALSINQSLPRNARNEKMYRNILSEIISVNRSCDEIDAAKGFCFCDFPRNKAVTKELEEADRGIIEFVIDRINTMTGNGKYDCLKLDAADFKVITHLEHGKDGDVELVLQHEKHGDGMNAAERVKMKEENRILSYFVYVERERNGNGEMMLKIPNLERDGMKVPLIERLDYFKFETCITREYDILPFKQPDSEFFDQFKNTNNDLPPVVFKNIIFTQSLLREIDQINLRLCKCKSS